MSTDQPTARVAVITGASSGIGEATARAWLLQPGDGVLPSPSARSSQSVQAVPVSAR